MVAKTTKVFQVLVPDPGSSPHAMYEEYGIRFLDILRTDLHNA
jgi:hypothetical protein